MAETDYQYDEQGFREDLKDKPDVLHQPDADRSAWEVQTLDYDTTLALLKGDEAVKPEYQFDDQVLEKLKKDVPEIDGTATPKVIEDKYQQILLARYNVAQEQNVTVGLDKKSADDEN